jgi:transcriptional regulator with XRE-family HTH domain
MTDVARRIGIAPQALSRVENGREVPWPALRKKLSLLYDIPESELFADIDDGQRHLRQIAGRGEE